MIRFNERFELKDKQVDNETLLNTLINIKDKNDNDPITFFEITSAAFFELASKHTADYTLLEVGLGGRLDSSNVIKPLISVISSISLDHQDFLGDKIEQIAFEKSGIIKKNVLLLLVTNPTKKQSKYLLIKHNI